MPKRKSIAYDSDDDEVYVLPPSSPDRPLGQSARRTGKKAKKQASDSDVEEVEVLTPVKKPKPSGSKPQSTKKPRKDKPSRDREDSPQAGSPHEFKVGVNDRGEKYIDMGKKRRVTVNTFKGGKFVDIREFYGDDGDLKPGKKGISLSQEQWETLKSSADVIDALLAKLK